jgi:hypothetical protein
VGSWEKGERDGQGIQTYAGGARYEGTWKSDRRHGKGSLVMANNDKFVGNFKNGKVRTAQRAPDALLKMMFARALVACRCTARACTRTRTA